MSNQIHGLREAALATACRDWQLVAEAFAHNPAIANLALRTADALADEGGFFTQRQAAQYGDAISEALAASGSVVNPRIA